MLTQNPVARGAKRLIHSFLFLALAVPAAGANAVDVRLDPPATVCFTPQTAVVHLANTGGESVTLTVLLAIDMPFGGKQQRSGGVTVAAHGTTDVKLLYELYEPGRHTFTVSVREGGKEVAKSTIVVEVPASGGGPWRFPNYYRQQLRTESDGRVVVDRTPGAADVVPKPAGVRPLVSVGADNRLVKGGKPWFPIGIYVTPNSEHGARELAEAGFDLVSVDVMPPVPLRHVLDLLQGWGLHAWVPVSDLLQFADGDPAKKQSELSALVAGVGDHPALALWESMDEPAWGGQPAWGLREGYRFLRALDPRRPIWTNHAPRNRVQTLAFYNQATDIAGCDIYPVPMPQGQSDLPNKTLSVVGDETEKNISAVRGEKPVFMVLQGFAWRALNNRADPMAVYPTFAESRFMADDAIVAGASGILYWGVPYSPRPSPFWSDLKSVVSELRGLKPFLEAPREGVKVTLSPANSPIRCLARRVNGHAAVLLVNRSQKDATVTVSPMGAHGPWHCLFGDIAPRDAGKGFVLTLPPWGARAVTEDPAWRPVRRDYSAEARNAQQPQPLPTEPGNAVPNPGFEADNDGVPAGWEIRLPFTVFRDTAVKRSGQASMRIESPDVGAAPLAVMQPIIVKPDTKYRLTGWMRSDTLGVKGRIYAEWNNASGWHSYVLPWVQPTTEWRQWGVDVTTTNNPEGHLYVVVQAQDKGRVWFDDLRLVEAMGP